MREAATLAYWHLGSTSMLLWAAAALLPILIHLWSRRRYQSTQWAAMTFLMAAMRQNARRVRLEQWLLLVVRTLLLVLFALALADPMASVFSTWSGAGQGRRTHTIIVIDGSYSMDYRDQEQTRFERAKQYARELIDRSSQGDGFTLVLLAAPPRAVIAQPVFDRDDLLQELESLQLTHSEAYLPATLAIVENLVKQAQDRYPRLARSQVTFLTDLQRSTWRAATTNENRDRLNRLTENASLSLVDFGEAGEENVGVARLDAMQPLSTVATETNFQVEVQNYSGNSLPRQRVTLHVDGQLAAEQRVDLEPVERASLVFPHRFEQSGEHLVEVRLGEDRLRIDNHRWLSVPVQEAIRVLCVYGQPGESRYVALALQPDETDRPRVKVEESSESAIVESDLKSFDCVVLCNVGRINREEGAVLQRYVSGGGGLIIFLGDQVQADSYNQHLGELAGASRLLPAKLGDTSRESQYRLNPLNYAHPLVSPFRGHEKSGLLTTPIWTYVRLEPNANAKVALAFDNGDPALVEERVGQGRVILFASAASPASVNRTTDPPTPWTAISSWPSFPPLVQEMLTLSLSGRTEGRNQLVGEDLRGDVASATPDSSVEVSGPGITGERLPLVFDAQGAHWDFTSATRSGPYEVTIANATAETQQFVLNVDTRESDLERIAADALPSQLTTEVVATGTVPEPGVPQPSQSYFRELLLGVIGLAVVEVMLAWHLGRGTA
jgi:hypothetical protein